MFQVPALLAPIGAQKELRQLVVVANVLLEATAQQELVLQAPVMLELTQPEEQASVVELFQQDPMELTIQEAIYIFTLKQKTTS